MKNFLLFFLLGIGIIIQGWAQEEQEVDFSANVGLKLSLNRIGLEDQDGNNQNTLLLNTINLEFNYEFIEDFFIKGIAGYGMRSFSEPVSFPQLPNEIRWDDNQFNSMLFGIGIWADPLYWRNFTLGFEIELWFYRLFQQEAEFVDPILSGQAFLENSFLQFMVNLLFQYDGFDSMILFAGPSLNLVSGTVKAQETVSGQLSEQELDFRQKRTLGMICGVYLSAFDHFDLEFRLGLFSSFSLSFGILYDF